MQALETARGYPGFERYCEQIAAWCRQTDISLKSIYYCTNTNEKWHGVSAFDLLTFTSSENNDGTVLLLLILLFTKPEQLVWNIKFYSI